jgi:hypothetical protein
MNWVEFHDNCPQYDHTICKATWTLGSAVGACYALPAGCYDSSGAKVPSPLRVECIMITIKLVSSPINAARAYLILPGSTDKYASISNFRREGIWDLMYGEDVRERANLELTVLGGNRHWSTTVVLNTVPQC